LASAEIWEFLRKQLEPIREQIKNIRRKMREMAKEGEEQGSLQMAYVPSTS